MPGAVRDGDSWKPTQGMWVHDGNTWKELTESQVQDGGSWQSYFVGVAPEVLRPNADEGSSGFVDSVGGDDNGDLWDEVDESSPDDDTTYITASGPADGTAVETVRFGLTNPSEGHSSDQTHTVRFRGEQQTGSAVEPTVRVFQDNVGEVADSGPLSNLGTDWGTHTYTLSQTEADLISDWDNLYVEIEYRLVGAQFVGAIGALTWVELDIG